MSNASEGGFFESVTRTEREKSQPEEYTTKFDISAEVKAKKSQPVEFKKVESQ